MGLRTAITLSAGMLLLAGCTADPGAPARAATYESAACPDDVEVMLVAAHTCGYVVIPRDTGPDLRIFALSVDPPGKPFGGPILETGTDLGMTPSYSGLAPIAERTGRRVVIVDLPGTGHSTPSLNCPEVDALPARTATATEVARAVGSCRARLAAAGVPTSDFTVSALGSDLHDIISALGGRGWVVMAHGTSGRAAATLAAEHPEQVAALVLSSPTYRDETPVRPIVADVARRCAANRGCTARYGDPLRNWTEAIGRARRAPLRIRMQQQTLVMDADHVVAAVRWLVAPAVRGAGQLPALLAELASRRPDTELELYAATALAAPPLCVGYLPRCETGSTIAIGAALSSLCPDVADAPRWQHACAAWGVAADTRPPAPVRNVPTLALIGRYDPFADPTTSRADLARLAPHAFVVEDPNGGHNVLAGECLREVRNSWLVGDPHDPPSHPPCMRLPLAFTETPHA